MKGLIKSTVFLCALSLSGCEKTGLCKDDELQMRRLDFTGNQLNVDGYYFGDPNSRNSVKIYYLYRNGIFFDGGVEALEDAGASSFPIDIANEFPRTVKGAWGVFQIDGSIIEIERWQSSSDGCETTLYERGDILNDSTFVIRLREYRKSGRIQRTEAPGSIFYFRALPQKPDSTNGFIR